MKALILNDNKIHFETEYPDPIPADGEVLVKVIRAGICETDLQLIQGYMGFQGILGHEFVGVAQEGKFAGQRVVGEINNSCHQCSCCKSGLENHCPSRSVLGILNHDGAFADFVCIPEENLHQVPDEVTDIDAVFTEPLAAAFQMETQIKFRPEHKVVLLGDGRLGNLCAQVVAKAGTQLTVVGKHENKLNLLKQIGIETILLSDLSKDRTADIVIDCTGSASGLEYAFQLVKPGGTIVLKTTVAGKQEIALAPIVIDEINLIGSRCGPFDLALDALKKKQIQLDGLLNATFPLNNAVQAMNRAKEKGVLKIQLQM